MAASAGTPPAGSVVVGPAELLLAHAGVPARSDAAEAGLDGADGTTAGNGDGHHAAGGDVMGVDWRVNIDQAWMDISYRSAVQGNLDPAVLFAPLPELKMRVHELLKRTGARPGHIFNLGHGILPETPVENVKAVVEMVREFRP